jgi:murein DD-endopeptidase MepM/ murein hydrolase activator NlpD
MAASLPLRFSLLVLLLPLWASAALAHGNTQGLPRPEALPPRPELVPAETPVADLGRQPGFSASSGQELALALRPAEPLQLVYPLDQPALGIDPYGWRYSESRKAWRMHAGQDLMAQQGTAVLAMLPAQVLLVDVTDGYGLTVVLDHGGGWQSLYAHLLDAAVKPGETVLAGQPIARVGQTGRATGPHLHVELRRLQDGRMLAVDPNALLERAALLLTPGSGSLPLQAAIPPLPPLALP